MQLMLIHLFCQLNKMKNNIQNFFVNVQFLSLYMSNIRILLQNTAHERHLYQTMKSWLHVCVAYKKQSLWNEPQTIHYKTGERPKLLTKSTAKCGLLNITNWVKEWKDLKHNNPSLTTASPMIDLKYVLAFSIHMQFLFYLPADF
jgi:hypothetical protein